MASTCPGSVQSHLIAMTFLPVFSAISAAGVSKNRIRQGFIKLKPKQIHRQLSNLGDYIGDLLDSYRPVMQYDEVLDMGSGNDTSVHTAEYELTIPEYDDLLIQLAKRNELPAEQLFDTTSAMVLIIVRQ